MKIVMTNGYASFNEWVRAGYPGSVSSSPERQPDPRVGLCRYEDCPKVEWLSGYCFPHYMLLRTGNAKRWQQ